MLVRHFVVLYLHNGLLVVWGCILKSTSYCERLQHSEYGEQER